MSRETEDGWGKPSSWRTTLGLEQAPRPGGFISSVLGPSHPPRLSEAPPICVPAGSVVLWRPAPFPPGAGVCGDRGKMAAEPPCS